MWHKHYVPLLATLIAYSAAKACKPSKTRAAGFLAPQTVCSGQLIFEDNFDEFDLHRWQHEITLAGGGNYEFEWYTNNRTNSYTHNGTLYIKPSLTADDLGEAFLTSGTLNLEGGAPADRCTNPTSDGCVRTGTPTNIINPIKSARIRTVESFNFRYGRVEVRAKMPAGDWLWPAIWMMPAYNSYGTWPSSGEIDLLESRGNRHMNVNNETSGTQLAASSLHLGPYPQTDVYYQNTQTNAKGYDADFHRYQMEWTPEYIRFKIDDVETGTIEAPESGFWDEIGFSDVGDLTNPWKYGTKLAPFDQNFYIIMNVAVGGITPFFPDEGLQNPDPKPWKNDSPHASKDFWDARSAWLPTWDLKNNNGENAALQVDYVRVWAL